MNETEEQKLKDLRAVITAELGRRMGNGFNLNEIAEWLIREKREATVEALEALIGDAVEKWNDDCSVQGILKRNPAMSELVPLMRMVSETLGVGVWYLLTLPDDGALEVCTAANLAWRLRADEDFARAKAFEAENELIEPVWKDHPEMTMGEAMLPVFRPKGFQLPECR
jgi:hypothetical protein